jgi:hypothetical protein
VGIVKIDSGGLRAMFAAEFPGRRGFAVKPGKL